MNLWLYIISVNVCILYSLAAARVIQDYDEIQPVKNETQHLEPEEIACIQELSLDEATKTIVTENSILPTDNPTVDEYAFCFWKKKGWINEDNEIVFNQFKLSVEGIVKDIWPQRDQEFQTQVFERLWNVIKVCENAPTVNGSPGQKAVATNNCVSKQMKSFNEGTV